MPVFNPLPPDRCPGVLRPHLAADGALLRIRVPGGRIGRRGLAALSRIAADFGDGDLHLTSRGNVQIRGISTTPEGEIPNDLSDSVAAAGFLPSFAHERVRNIVASPLSGIVGGRMDVRPVVAALDRALCADPRLAELPGRFLFGLDDGRADLAEMPCDLGARAVDGESAQLRVGALPGPVVAREEIASALTALALRFLDLRADLWNVRRLPGKGRELLDGAEFPESSGDTGETGGPDAEKRRRNGRHGILPVSDSEAAVAGSVPLGILTPALQRALLDSAGHGSETIVLTPWRGAVVAPLGADRAERAAASLAAAGLVLDPDSPWSRVSACVGSPGCSRSRGDTRSRAADLVRRLETTDVRDDGLPVHVAGCERACGAPHTPHTRILIGSST
ncbi:precorrin-3B synthase [Thermobifida halotolerans]